MKVRITHASDKVGATTTKTHDLSYKKTVRVAAQKHTKPL
jgi:hypothetical protein